MVPCALTAVRLPTTRSATCPTTTGSCTSKEVCVNVFVESRFHYNSIIIGQFSCHSRPHIVMLLAGGWCYNLADCAGHALTFQGSSTTYPETLAPSGVNLYHSLSSRIMSINPSFSTSCRPHSHQRRRAEQLVDGQPELLRVESRLPAMYVRVCMALCQWT
jgi:hypothetical protein